jgi:hypothetical protein
MMTAGCNNQWYRHLMEPRPPLSSLTVQELRARAQEHRDMAVTARTLVVHDGLLKLASRFDAMADAKEEAEPKA